MDYAGWITTVCTLLEYTVVDANSATPTGTVFDSVYPSAIEYTENRIQRDLDLLSSQSTATGTLQPNTRIANLPVTNRGEYIVVQQVRLVIDDDGQAPLENVSRETLDFIWPSDNSIALSVLPQQWTTRNQNSIMVGPAPASATTFEVVGTTRVIELASDNTSNNLTDLFPDLYVAASMVWFSGYQRDFGSQSDDPKVAQSWESQYQTLLSTAMSEEKRKKTGDLSPSPSNTPVTG